MRTHLFLALIALSFTTSLPTQAQTAAAPPPAVTPIAETALPDYPGKEVLMLTVEYPPGGHTHGRPQCQPGQTRQIRRLSVEGPGQASGPSG
jgi:hypothetical protein